MYFIPKKFFDVNLRYDLIDCRYSLSVSDVEILMKNNNHLSLFLE